MPEQTLFEVRDLAVAFGNGAARAVDGVSFDVRAGETLALVGESGSGKSLTALSLLQLLPPGAHHPTGSIRYRGRELIGAPEPVLRDMRGNRVGMVFQEPMTSLNPLHTIEKQIRETLVLHKAMNKKAARERTLELLRLVGLPNAESRLNAFPHELSGGQRQRVMIAMALANEPDVLIADEPTTALDVTIQAQILELLKDLQQRLGMALVLITHDLGIVRRIAERVCVMNQGKIVERGEVAEVFAAPRHEYTQRLLAAEPKGRPGPADERAPVVMEARDVKVWFPILGGLLRRPKDYIKAVDGVSLKVRSGQTVGIVGESGSGKTTLGMALLRLTGSEGTIVFQGRTISGERSKALRPLRRAMQIVFQDPFGSLSPRMSVGQIIEEGLRVHEPRMPAFEREQRITEALRETGLDPEARHRYPHEFSGGQRQRISIARAMVLKPKLVVLDEPTSALDVSVQAQIIELLRALQAKHQLAYIFISHDLRVVRALSHEVIVMRGGRVVEHGSGDRIFEAPTDEYTRQLIKAAFDTTLFGADREAAPA
ncbi:ABC transporter ATP-binding protein [Ectothiorhodospiraceae bacterium 2226]|nr:ABC transporter ATP-binding protein [Ectothiorhodospiraceae bacterium 2226]